MKDVLPRRILVTRTDRLGDVILATPVLRELKKKFPEAKIYFLVQKAWMPVLQYGQEIEVIAYDPDISKHELAQQLKEFAFDRVYVLRDERKLTQALRSCCIPERIGPYSSLRSFYSFNYGRFQKRSRCKLHEAEYNLDLVHPQIAAEAAEDLPRAWIETSAKSKLSAQEFLKEQNLTIKGFAVIHPGSSGSARYVKLESLYQLAKRIRAKGMGVCVSGGPAETELLEAFQSAVPSVKILGGKNSIGLDGMAEVYRQAKLVIAHGTGPLHLAAAVETPTLAIFSPIFVLSEKRWGPLISKREVWVPEVSCPAKFRCHGPRCLYYDCMDLFNVDLAMEMLEKLIS